MLIIDSNTDYYDFVSHVYGQDKKVIFDRRGSEVLWNEVISSHCGVFSKERRWRPDSFLLLFEYGAVQKIIQFYDLQFIDGDALSLEPPKVRTLHTYRENKHLTPSPITVARIRSTYGLWKWGLPRRGEAQYPPERFIPPSLGELSRSLESPKNMILNPILRETSLTQVVDPYELWKEVQNYLSSLNNEERADTDMTDKERAELHGFDKHSFRHPTKL